MSELLLMRDALENIQDFIQGGTQDLELRIFKRVIREAYREFVDRHPWSFYDQEATLLLDATSTTLLGQYVHATNYLKSSFLVTNATNTSPVVITVDADFAGEDGETVYVKDINTVADGDYVLNETGTNQFELVGSTTLGAFVATGDEIVYRTTFTSSQVGSRFQVDGESASYPIIEYVDEWTLKIHPRSNPGQDVAGSDITIEANRVELPDDFMTMSYITDSATLSWSDCYIRAEQWLGLEQTAYDTSTHPFRWTILPSRAVKNRWDICWTGSPGSDRTISFLYRRRPEDDLRYAGVETGATSAGEGNQSVATTAASKTVTGTSTAFTAAMVGSYLRIGPTKASARSEPSGLDGSSPYIEQHRIASYTSATSITLETAAENTASSQAFVVSDLIDISVEHYNAFYALCELKYVQKTADADRISAAQAKYRDALILAMEVDNKYSGTRSAMDRFVTPSPFGSPRNADFGTYVSTPFG